LDRNAPDDARRRGRCEQVSTAGQREIQTRKRVITFLCDALGYDSLGHWEDREGNSNTEEEWLSV